ncbi:carbohydrate ABC transporter permease [Cohnella laeviribosi]|uniref:carbohydrate ABC transporter permease n=1 Tax=Cohnella laeviribosi TaxID=380174 RepID=UPI0003690DB2|nr:sugar ABC transporter permease [Cohnella laeviribosi]
MKNGIRLYSYRLVIPALILYCVFFILPTITGLYYSFTDWSPMNDAILFNGLDNFRYIFQNEVTRLAIKNTLIYAVIVVIFKNALGLLLAVALNAGLKTRNLLRAVFFAPSIVSTIVIGLVFIPILHPEGLLNRLLAGIGLESLGQYWLSDAKIVIFTIAGVSIWQWAGYHMVIYLAGLQGISNDYYEAAKIDGANGFKRFIHITIPLLSASLNINLILSLIGGIRVFSEVYALTNGGPGNASQVLSTFILVLFGEGRWGLGTALNTVLFVFVAIVAIPLLHKMRKQEVEV